MDERQYPKFNLPEDPAYWRAKDERVAEDQSRVLGGTQPLERERIRESREGEVKVIVRSDSNGNVSVELPDGERINLSRSGGNEQSYSYGVSPGKKAVDRVGKLIGKNGHSSGMAEFDCEVILDEQGVAYLREVSKRLREIAVLDVFFSRRKASRGEKLAPINEQDVPNVLRPLLKVESWAYGYIEEYALEGKVEPRK